MIDLLPYQQEWVNRKERFKIWVHARQIGATTAIAHDLVHNTPEGSHALWLCESRSLDNIVELLQSYSDKPLSIEKREGSLPSVKIPGGGQVVIASNGCVNWPPRSAGVWSYRVVVDNAAWHPCLQSFANQQLKTFGMTQLSIVSAWEENSDLPIVMEDSRLGFLQVTTIDTAIAQGLYRKICGATNQAWSEQSQANWRNKLIEDIGESAKQELFCGQDFVAAGGLL